MLQRMRSSIQLQYGFSVSLPVTRCLRSDIALLPLSCYFLSIFLKKTTAAETVIIYSSQCCM